MEEQQQQQPQPQQHQQLPQHQSEPQLLPPHLEESMRTLAGHGCTVVAEVMMFMTSLALNPNDPFRRERAEAALECARVATRAAEEAKNISPTPNSVFVAKLAQNHLHFVEEIMRNHF